ncbi:class I SAM-dependent methyltransferase [beta proteobacterium MWH-UniP1]
MNSKVILPKIQSATDVVIFGAGKMGQQLAALLRNLPMKINVKYFLANSGTDTVVDGLAVRAPSEVTLGGNELVLVASARSNHFDIANSLAGKIPHEQVLFLSAVDMDDLKRLALSAMLYRIGIDPVLLKSMTNDLFGSITMFDNENYNGNIRRRMFDIALEESAHFVMDSMPEARAFSDVWSYRQWVLEKSRASGLCLEFGVADGSTLDFFAKIRPESEFFGFDSFIGLPEFWKDGFDKGRFAQPRLPEVPRNVQLIKGWFSDTIPAFFAQSDFSHKEISFLHVDCDLYSSTRDVLTGCASGLRPGTVVAFDEYFNYPGWQGHEHKALLEFARERGMAFRYIAYVENGNQVSIEITSITQSA